MSSVYEKLEQFNQITLKEAASQRNEMLKEIIHDKEIAVNRKRAELKNQADELLKNEFQKINKEKNDIISKSFKEGRQLLRETREKILSSVLNELDRKIEEFVSGKDYPSFLENCIRYAYKQAGEGERAAVLNTSDIEKHSGLLNRIKDELGISIIESEEDIKGGCMIFNKTANLVIDNSISSRMQQSREKFLKTSCLRID